MSPGGEPDEPNLTRHRDDDDDDGRGTDGRTPAAAPAASRASTFPWKCRGRGAEGAPTASSRPRRALPRRTPGRPRVTERRRRQRAHGGRKRARWSASSLSLHVTATRQARAPPPVLVIIAKNQYGSNRTAWLDHR